MKEERRLEPHLLTLAHLNAEYILGVASKGSLVWGGKLYETTSVGHAKEQLHTNVQVRKCNNVGEQALSRIFKSRLYEILSALSWQKEDKFVGGL